MTEWREGQAVQYDFYVAELDKLLAELDNAEAICQALDEPGLETETRSYAGGVRALRDTLISRASELRRSPPELILPMSLTTRRLKR